MILSFLSLVPRVALVLLMVVVLVDMFLGVVFRYLVGRALPWTEEVGTLSLVYLTFIGGAVGINRGAHFAIHVATERLGRPARRALGLVVAGLIMLIGLLLLPTGWNLVLTNSRSETPALGLNLGLLYASTVIGGVLIICYAAALAAGILRGELPGDHVAPEPGEPAVAA